jgi:molecular chaperone GrpE
MSDTEHPDADQSVPTTGGAGDQASADIAELTRQLEKANQSAQEYLSLAQRTQADLVNYRRRVEQERGESLNAGKTLIAMRILPALDDFDRAIKARPADLAQNDWALGVDLIARKLKAALEAEGVTRIEALGAEFNPWEHEAMMQAPSSDDDAGKVTEVFREGYKLGDKIIRPAQVIVGKGTG